MFGSIGSVVAGRIVLGPVGRRRACVSGARRPRGPDGSGGGVAAIEGQCPTRYNKACLDNSKPFTNTGFCALLSHSC